ncbi:MAG: ATP-dependent zinc metalloprotease FtsH [Clostridiales bacterium]|nr:ATP-dependent zinc metalloprotease FtsH [Clostridiales bacterium]PWM23511.1 MAG: cell division protein FtsH [Clostridiales bacterium]
MQKPNLGGILQVNDKPGNKKKIPIFAYYIILLGIVLIISYTMLPKLMEPDYKEISFSEFVQKVENDEAQQVEVNSKQYTMKPKDFETSNVYYVTGNINNEFHESTALLSLLDEKGIKYDSPIVSSNIWLEILIAYVLPTVIMVVLFVILMRSMNKRMGGGVMSFGKNTSKIYAEKSTGKTFADVAGQDEAKQNLVEIIDFLNNPGKYTAIGAKLPKGALLVGPPGTGKTLMAKAVAGEAKVPFFSLSGSEFVEMFVGVGASRVRDLFRQAVENAPCIVFIDEIDAIGKSRDNGLGSNDEREQTLNQLLAEMDGFDSSKGVVILAATNRPEVLDKALLRPGRFDRRIIVDLPDQKGRVDILKVHARNVLMEPDVDFEVVARATPGASGADLENIINEAALRAVRAGKVRVSQQELDEAIEVIIAGEEKKNRVMSNEEKKIVAYHETGHALVTSLLTHTEPVHKITIIPRTSGTLGYVMHVAKKEKVLLTKKELLEEIIILTGGRASEEIEFDSVTTGASNDIERATEMARNIITTYGMSDTFGFVNWQKKNSMYLVDTKTMNCSDATFAKIDAETHAIIADCYQKALALLKDHKATLDAIAAVLYEKENLTGDEFRKLFSELEPDIVLASADEGV